MQNDMRVNANDIASLKLRIEEIQAALKPFSDLADEIELMADKTGTGVEDWARSCAWEDLMRARSALRRFGHWKDAISTSPICSFSIE